ncbi:unnamed protein product [Triticum turgidum subsp. durum]|uniref:Uncharacterized protein n=1 Tax=Triticum turgidum subsp. durum TaxID=4567 RepID=A0A9R0ZE36_TRITD|nr:unnamed protein product [Triticum turgidum subsp. durum]
MATAYDEDHSISPSQNDDTDDRRSTIPAASADEKPFPFFGLLCYADKVDWLLMALGTVGSAIHGMAFPIGYLLLGKALDAFGTNINNQEAMVHALYKVNMHAHITLLNLGCGSVCVVHGGSYFSCWNVVQRGTNMERQEWKI